MADLKEGENVPVVTQDTLIKSTQITTSAPIKNTIEIILETNVDVDVQEINNNKEFFISMLTEVIRNKIQRGGVTVTSIRPEFIENMGDTNSKIRVIVEFEVSNENIADEVIEDFKELIGNSNSGIKVAAVTLPVISVSRRTLAPPVPTSGREDNDSNTGLIIGVTVGILIIAIVIFMLKRRKTN